MFRSVQPAGFGPLVASVALVACNLTSSIDHDSGIDPNGQRDGEEVGTDAEAEDSSDGPGESEPGRLVAVMQDLQVILDRPCDLDGNGTPDNAVADLGSPDGTIFAEAFTAVMSGNIDDGLRLMFHFPSIPDVVAPSTGGSTTLIVHGGRDTDAAEDATRRDDDFSGSEPFFAVAESLDGCGEPLFVLSRATIDAGRLVVREAVVPLPVDEDSFLLEGVTIEGTVEPHGASMTLTFCGYSTIREIGASTGLIVGDDLSVLEVLLAGGGPFGLSGIPGLAPDVDLDGDGLERLELDTEGHLARCVDGDDTVIEGHDCWQDPRMADGVSFVWELTAVSARFAGREPRWEYLVAGACPDGPPAESHFDSEPPPEGSPAATGEPCDPLLVEPCSEPEHVCTGMTGNGYACLRRCAVTSPCLYGDRPGECVHFDEETQLCVPLGAWPVASDGCSPGSTGCEHELEVDGPTRCVGFEGVAQCFEECVRTPPDCPSPDSEYCTPLPFDEGGVCRPFG